MILKIKEAKSSIISAAFSTASKPINHHCDDDPSLISDKNRPALIEAGKTTTNTIGSETNAISNEILSYVRSCDPGASDAHKDSEVARFYAGRSVFITGASGFIGKCLLEKLLRSCPDLRRAYILMRPKRGQAVEQRVAGLVKSELFDRLRESPDGLQQLSKIIAIKGDITKPRFDLEQRDIDLMSESVSLVFHSAATVRFDEPMRDAVQNNVVSVENMLDLASQLKNLEALVHVSTAYSNCDRKQVDERFYETPIEPQRLIDMTKWMKPETFEEIAPILLGKRPNTYTYTKAVAESLLMERSKQLLPNVPIAMVRPSIVAGIWRQPICGWVDNFNGPTGVILSMMTGSIQAMLGHSDYCADIVPVDIVANLIICSAWEVHKKKNEEARLMVVKDEQPEHSLAGNVSIFHCVSSTLNPVKWSDFARYVKPIGMLYPCSGVMRWPGSIMISNECLFSLFNFLNHTLVAYTGDFCLLLMGKNPSFVKMHDRLMKMVNSLKPFTTNQWLFNCTNVTSLYNERLAPIDREIFNFDIRQVRWADYLRRYYIGSKIYALKDDPKDVVKARRRLARIQLVSRTTQFLLLLLMYYLLINGTSLEQYVVDLLKNVFSMTTKTTVFNEDDYSLIDKQDGVEKSIHWTCSHLELDESAQNLTTSNRFFV